MAPQPPLNGVALRATSVADDIGYVALSDLAGLLGAATYRIIGGHMVTALAARWQLGPDLYRETGDIDLGVPRWWCGMHASSNACGSSRRRRTSSDRCSAIVTATAWPRWSKRSGCPAKPQTDASHGSPHSSIASSAANDVGTPLPCVSRLRTSTAPPRRHLVKRRVAGHRDLQLLRLALSAATKSSHGPTTERGGLAPDRGAPAPHRRTSRRSPRPRPRPRQP